MSTLDQIRTDSGFVPRILLFRLSWELFPVISKAEAKCLRRPAKGLYFSSAEHRVPTLFKIQLTWPDSVSIYFSIYSYYFVGNIILIFICFLHYRTMDWNSSQEVLELSLSNEAKDQDSWIGTILGYPWFSITDSWKSPKVEILQLLCVIWFSAVQKLSLMLKRHHKSQLVAVAPCFKNLALPRVWQRCPNSFKLILSLACFSTGWKSPVLSICSIRQVSHYLTCLPLSTSVSQHLPWTETQNWTHIPSAALLALGGKR